MDILKFTLKGQNAFFKKPDVNSYFYFTYGNIHKVAVIGILGAVLGYSGYNKNKLIYTIDKNSINNKVEKEFPEFYEKLNDLKIAIVPNNKKGFILKKIQSFNNSVGYASQEQGGNLIVKEQWLENPSWDIFILIENEEGRKIADYLLNNKAIYLPYLGTNDHYADIIDIELFSSDKYKIVDEPQKINGLFAKDDFNLLIDDEEEDDDNDDIYKYQEKLPVSINKHTHLYELKGFICTNLSVVKKRRINVYNVDNRNIVFY